MQFIKAALRTLELWDHAAVHLYSTCSCSQRAAVSCEVSLCNHISHFNIFVPTLVNTSSLLIKKIHLTLILGSSILCRSVIHGYFHDFVTLWWWLYVGGGEHKRQLSQKESWQCHPGCHFGPEWNITATTGWIQMKWCTVHHYTGCILLTFPPAPPWVWHFGIFSGVPQPQLDGLMWHYKSLLILFLACNSSDLLDKNELPPSSFTTHCRKIHPEVQRAT